MLAFSEFLGLGRLELMLDQGSNFEDDWLQEQGLWALTASLASLSGNLERFACLEERARHLIYFWRDLSSSAELGVEGLQCP